jgi:hypothetical protein
MWIVFLNNPQSRWISRSGDMLFLKVHEQRLVPFHNRFCTRPQSLRCDLTVPYFCFPPFLCLSTGSHSNCVRSSLYSLKADPEKTPLPLLLRVDTQMQICLPHSCVAKSAARAHREHRLQHLFYCCVMSQRTWRVPMLRMYGPLPSNGSFSASRSCFAKVRHISPSLRLLAPSSLSVCQLHAPAALPPGKEARVPNVFPSTLILFKLFT